MYLNFAYYGYIMSINNVDNIVLIFWGVLSVENDKFS